MNIVETHKRNFEFIKKHNIKVGDIVTLDKGYDRERKVVHIHSKYGWLSGEQSMIPIADIIKVNGVKIKR